MTNILYTVAKDKNGQLIKANDAEKGNDFFCPLCKSELILRKSGKTGKGTKRPHFAHRALTPNCTPETALHYSFKNLLADKLQRHITTQTPLHFTWNCEYCSGQHSGNLLKKVKAVNVEYNLRVCKPDIALLSDNDEIFGVVEIVVTHKPDENTLKYYSDNNIILIQINLTSDKDIDELDNRISHPNKVGICFNPKCKICGHFKATAIMTIIEGPCWKCDSTMKVATISTSSGDLVRGSSNNLTPSDFTSDEIAFAKSKGVILKIQYSKTVNERYIANSCAKCGSFAGDFYLFSQYISPASRGELPSQEYDIGYHCDFCNNFNNENDEFE
ncbi:MAG TPA: competence protein CoiA family protein [Chitinophagales bacterium]|nr:competence protein CoiA family protein [Chitinophagales bacterium]